MTSASGCSGHELPPITNPDMACCAASRHQPRSQLHTQPGIAETETGALSSESREQFSVDSEGQWPAEECTDVMTDRPVPLFCASSCLDASFAKMIQCAKCFQTSLIQNCNDLLISQHCASAFTSLFRLLAHQELLLCTATTQASRFRKKSPRGTSVRLSEKKNRTKLVSLSLVPIAGTPKRPQVTRSTQTSSQSRSL